MNNHNYSNLLDGLQNLIDNPNPRIPVLLCLDVSGSMSGAPISELNRGVQQFIQEMKDDELTRNSTEIAVVTFNDQATCVADFSSVDDLQVPSLQASGRTATGEGVTMALDMLDARKQCYRSTGVEYYQPILVVMSDGEPNGDPRIKTAAISRIQKLVGERRLSVVSVGIGEGANQMEMDKLSPARSAVHLSGIQFREFFAWLSASVSAVAVSVPEENVAPDYSALMNLSAEPWPDQCL